MADAGWGLYALAPLAVTLVLAFVTRSALIAMLLGTFVGTLMLGGVPGASLNMLLQSALGNAEFIWIVLIVLLIGILFEASAPAACCSSCPAAWRAAMATCRVAAWSWPPGASAFSSSMTTSARWSPAR